MSDNELLPLEDSSGDEDNNDNQRGMRRGNDGVFDDDLSPLLQRQRLEDDEEGGGGLVLNRGRPNNDQRLGDDDDDDDLLLNGGNRGGLVRGPNNGRRGNDVDDDDDDLPLNGVGPNNGGRGNVEVPPRNNFVHGYVPVKQQLLVAPKHQLNLRDPLQHITIMASPQSTINSIDQLTGTNDGDDSDDDSDDEDPFRISSLTKICTMGANYEGQDTNAMLGIITSIGIVNQVTYSTYRAGNNNGGRRGGTTTQTNQRVYHLACPLSPSGQNVCAVFENRRGERLVSNDVTHRDNGGICVGQPVLIASPCVRNEMTNGTPVLETPRPFFTLLSNIIYPQRLPVTNHTRQSAVFLNQVEVIVNSFSVGSHACNGNMCQLTSFITAYGNQNSATSCSCIRQIGLGNTTGITMNLSLNYDGGNGTLGAEGFMIKRFQQAFINHDDISEYLPIHYESRPRFVQKKLKKIFKYGNRHGGWDIIGWFRAATVADQGGDNGGGGDVVQGTINFHICSMMPHDASLFNMTEFEALKIHLQDLTE